MKSQIKISTVCAVALLTLGLAWAAAAAGQQYAIVDLGTLGGLESKAFDIGASGQVVGYTSNASGDYHAFRWDGAIHDLGAIFGANQKMAYSINPSGQIVGIGYNYGDLTSQAFGWLGGVTSSLGSFSARSINSSNMVVGCLNTPGTTVSQVDHACLWQSGSITDLGTLGGSFSYANDINSISQIVGASYLSDESTIHASMWHNYTIVDLGTLGGTNSQAYAANDIGKVVGWAQTSSGSVHAFLFTTDVAGNVTNRADLGALSSGWSYAYGINNSNQVVGTSGHAFLWDAGALTDLNSVIPPASGWVLAGASAISDMGQIVGWGKNPQGEPHGFLMFPLLTNGNAVKNLADAAYVGLSSIAVTAVFDGYFYVENSARTMGIRVVKANHGRTIGQTVMISGSMKTNSDGERYIDAAIAAPDGTGTVAPLWMTNKSLGGTDWNPSGTPGTGQKGVTGGAGLNNIGLLVRITGTVTFTGANYFYLNDGSGLKDKSGNVGVKVAAVGLALPAIGQVVQVTGVSSCFLDTVNTSRVVLARSPDGIVVVQ